MGIPGTTNGRLKLPWLLILALGIASYPNLTCAQDSGCNNGEPWLEGLPSLGTFSSTSNVSDSGLDILIDWANGFINVVQPNDLPYEIIRDAMNQTLVEKYEDDPKTFVLQGMEYMAGFIACFLIGLLYILVLPFVCFCFCCCRCCGNCGGKRVQKVTKYSTCKRVYFTISLLIITAVMGAGVACTSLSNDWVSESNGEIYDSFIYLLDDVVQFLDGSAQQLEHMASTELFDTTGLMLDELDNIGTRLGVPLQEYINETCEPVFQQLDTFSKTLDDTLVIMEYINDTLTVLQENATLLAAELEVTAYELNKTVEACGSACDDIDTSMLTLGMDFSTLPSLEDDLNALQDLLNQDFTNETEGAKEAYEGIPGTIEEQTADGVTEIKDVINNLEQDVQDAFANVTQLIDDIDTEVDKIKKESQTYWDLIKEIDDYRYYTLIGLACLTLLIVVLNIAGISMGLCGTKRNAHPMERTRLSNAGGNILMAGVTFSFFFSWLLILIVMILFFVLGNIGQLCEPLHSLEVWEETVDYPYLLNKDGYLLGGVIYDDPSINLTVSGILTDCGLDYSLYNALMLEHKINLTQLTGYREELDIESIINDIVTDIDLSDITIFPSELENTLLEFKSTLQNLSLAEYKEELSGNVTEVDLLTYADMLYDISSNSSLSEDISASLNESAANLTRLHYQYVVPMEIASDMLLEAVDELESNSLLLQNYTDELIIAFEEADEKISSNDTLKFIENELLLYTDELLCYSDKFVNYTVYQISEEFARCKPIRTMYDAAVVVLCNYAIDSLHLIWFTLGWCMFFYIPSIIFAVKLAKYYRIMHDEPKPKAKKDKKDKKKKKKNKNEVEDLAMKDMNGEPEIPSYGGDTFFTTPTAPRHMDHFYDTDTNELIQGQGHGAAAAVHYSSGPKTNPHYIHDEPIMAYDNPRGGQPPPYNDSNFHNGRPAAYLYRPLPETPHAHTDISSQYQRHLPQRQNQPSSNQNHKKKSSNSKHRPKHRESGKQHGSDYPQQQYARQTSGHYPQQAGIYYSNQQSSFHGNPGNHFSRQHSSQYGGQGSRYYDYPPGNNYNYQRSSSYQADGEDYLMPYELPQTDYHSGLYHHGANESSDGLGGSGSNWSFGKEPQQGRRPTSSVNYTRDVDHFY